MDLLPTVGWQLERLLLIKVVKRYGNHNVHFQLLELFYRLVMRLLLLPGVGDYGRCSRSWHYDVLFPQSITVSIVWRSGS